jgi:hypothetical protein
MLPAYAFCGSEADCIDRDRGAMEFVVSSLKSSRQAVMAHGSAGYPDLEEQNQQLRILGAKFEKDSSKFWEAFQVKIDKLFSSIVGDPSDSSTIQAQVAIVADAAALVNVEYELYQASRFSVLDPTQLQQAAAITSTAPPLWP